MGWKALRVRAVSAVISFSLFGCGGTEPSLIHGFWRVTSVETRALGGLARSESWQVDPATAYVLSFKNNQFSIPYQGMGLQQFQLPPGGGAYQMEDQRILLQSAQTALELREISDTAMVLAQVVNDPSYGNVEVQQTFEKMDEYTLRQLLTQNGVALPPELANGGMPVPTGYPGQAGPGTFNGPYPGEFPGQFPGQVPNQYPGMMGAPGGPMNGPIGPAMGGGAPGQFPGAASPNPGAFPSGSPMNGPGGFAPNGPEQGIPQQSVPSAGRNNPYPQANPGSYGPGVPGQQPGLQPNYPNGPSQPGVAAAPQGVDPRSPGNGALQAGPR
jgi:hypothetical protein